MKSIIIFLALASAFPAFADTTESDVRTSLSTTLKKTIPSLLEIQVSETNYNDPISDTKCKNVVELTSKTSEVVKLTEALYSNNRYFHQDSIDLVIGDAWSLDDLAKSLTRYCGTTRTKNADAEFNKILNQAGGMADRLDSLVNSY